jgi:hypothetical protein
MMLAAEITPGQIYRLRPNYRGPIAQMKVIRFNPDTLLRGGTVMASLVRANGTLTAPERFSGHYFAARVSEVLRCDRIVASVSQH